MNSKPFFFATASILVQPPSELSRVSYLDGWRGLAILLVLEAHFLGFVSADTGRLGVDIFFVLSGFLMSEILFIKKVPVAIFYKRRISRIIPVFLLFIVFVYLCDFLFLNTGEWNNVLYTISFTRTYFPSESGIWDATIPIGHLWSLNVEEHCYILLSTLTLLHLTKEHQGVILILSGIMSIVIQIAYIEIPSITPRDCDLRTEVVASHLLLSAGYHLIHHKFTKYISQWMPVLSFGIAVLCYTEVFPWWSSMIVSPFMLAFTVNHLSETYKFIHSLLSLSTLRLMGIWSYSIYLWQQPFFTYKSEFPVEILAVIPALISGLLSFYCFENPIRSWLNSKWN